MEFRLGTTLTLLYRVGIQDSDQDGNQRLVLLKPNQCIIHKHEHRACVLLSGGNVWPCNVLLRRTVPDKLTNNSKCFHRILFAK